MRRDMRRARRAARAVLAEPPPAEALAGAGMRQELTIARPDDWHLHLRDGPGLASVVAHSASVFKRAIVMPNLRPPVTTVEAAVAYRERILAALPLGSDFEPLMTLYLTDNTTSKEVFAASKTSEALTNTLGSLQAGSGWSVVHGEVTDPEVDIFDREKVFIQQVLIPLVDRLPSLRIVLEHITTENAVNFLQSCAPEQVGATVTAHHLLLSRNALFQGGLRPHHYCLPVLKRESHRQAVLKAVTSGSKQFFLGTDSAPHERLAKEAPCGCAGVFSAHAALPLYARAFEQEGALDKLEAFASFNGPDFYGLPRNSETVTLSRAPWRVPASYPFGEGIVVPFAAGETLAWAVT
eukprot:SM000093S24432  [mRNA]  locus=s93:334101:336770:+ [translate_table: standard]